MARGAWCRCVASNGIGGKSVRTGDLLLRVLSEDVVETRIPTSRGLGGRRSQRES